LRDHLTELYVVVHDKDPLSGGTLGFFTSPDSILI
jgi:hypothetical protein